MEVGLVDWAGGFLTGERFGGGVDVSGTALGWKQTWLLEACPEEAACAREGGRGRRREARLRGPGGRVLVAEAGGAVRMAEGAGAALRGGGSLFVLEAHCSGAWSLREAGPRGGRFLESDGEDVFCVRRAPPPPLLPPPPRCLWLPRLAFPALAALFHPPRGLFARADAGLGRVWADAAEPAGPECAFLVRGGRGAGGAVRLEACGGRRFLRGDGRLVAQPSPETALLLRLRPGGGAALSDLSGRALFPRGARGLLRPALEEEAREGEGREEEEAWFQLRRLPPRVALRSPAAARFLSVLAGGELYAGTRAASPLGSFLLETGLDGETLRLRAPNRKYLAQGARGVVRADGEGAAAATLFRALWLCGTVFLRGPDGRFLGTGPCGSVRATAREPGPREEFWVRLADRPFLVLRGACGFVGSEGGDPSSPSPSCCDRGRGLRLLLRGDRLEPDVVELLPCARGVYHLRSRGKGFWRLTSSGRLRAGGRRALNFCLELRGPHHLALLAPNGLYVRGDAAQGGALVADAASPAPPGCLWEF